MNTHFQDNSYSSSHTLKKRLLIAVGLVIVTLAILALIDWFNEAKAPMAESTASGAIHVLPQPEPLATYSEQLERATSASSILAASEPAVTTKASAPIPTTAAASVPSAVTEPTPTPALSPQGALLNQAPPAPAKPGRRPFSAAVASTPISAAPTTQVITPVTPGSAHPAGSSIGYHIQMGLFSSRQNADKLINTLKQQGIQAQSATRVYLGPFRTRAEADEAMKKLRQLGYTPLLLAAGK